MLLVSTVVIMGKELSYDHLEIIFLIFYIIYMMTACLDVAFLAFHVDACNHQLVTLGFSCMSFWQQLILFNERGDTADVS